VPAWLAMGSSSTLCSRRFTAFLLRVPHLCPLLRPLVLGAVGLSLFTVLAAVIFATFQNSGKESLSGFSACCLLALPACRSMPARRPASPLTSPFVFCPLPLLNITCFFASVCSVVPAHLCDPLPGACSHNTINKIK
jgi:hypothetical protein